jgi:hypothetical protein
MRGHHCNLNETLTTPEPPPISILQFTSATARTAWLLRLARLGPLLFDKICRSVMVVPL